VTLIVNLKGQSIVVFFIYSTNCLSLSSITSFGGSSPKSPSLSSLALDTTMPIIATLKTYPDLNAGYRLKLMFDGQVNAFLMLLTIKKGSSNNVSLSGFNVNNNPG
jgi:hypothetical protein